DGVPRESNVRYPDAVARLLTRRFSGAPIRPLFANIDPIALEELMARAAANSKGKRPQTNLFSFYRIACGEDFPVDELLKSVGALSRVEIAYVEGRVTNAGQVLWEADEYALKNPHPNTFPAPYTYQGYLDEAPFGIDARYAWNFPGGDGSGANL